MRIGPLASFLVVVKRVFGFLLSFYTAVPFRVLFCVFFACFFACVV